MADEEEVKEGAVDAVSHALDEVAAALPLHLGADFVPFRDEASRPGPELDPFQEASLRAEKAFDRAVRAGEAGDEVRAVHEYLRAAAVAEAAREWYLTAVCCQRVGDYLRRPPPPFDLERSLRMYRRAAAAYEACGLSAEARELSYRLMLLRMRSARDLKLPRYIRLELFLFWISSGFGFRPMRVIAMASLFIVIYGVLFWLSNGAIDVPTGKPVGLLDSLYFSGITFATVGYGDIIPSPHARVLALTEGFLGPFILGFFVVILSQRITKH